MMADTPAVPGVGGVSGDPSRQGGLAGRQRPPPKAPGERGAGGKDGQDGAILESKPQPIDPTAVLVEALDRLRATAELRPVEEELMRAMRGARHYQEESRHGLPVIPDPEAQEQAEPHDPASDPGPSTQG